MVFNSSNGTVAGRWRLAAAGILVGDQCLRRVRHAKERFARVRAAGRLDSASVVTGESAECGVQGAG